MAKYFALVHLEPVHNLSRIMKSVEPRISQFETKNVHL